MPEQVLLSPSQNELGFTSGRYFYLSEKGFGKISMDMRLPDLRLEIEDDGYVAGWLLNVSPEYIQSTISEDSLAKKAILSFFRRQSLSGNK